MKKNPRFASKKDLARIRDAMLVLTQHNCLVAELPLVDDDLPDDNRRPQHDRVLYSMSPASVLNQLRVPKAISVVKDLFGDIGMAIFEEFALHGRLGMAQVLHDVVVRITAEQSGDETMTDPTHIEAKVREIFEKMAADRFLQPVSLLMHSRGAEEEAHFGSPGLKAKSAADGLLADTKPSATKKAAVKKGKVGTTAGAGEKRKRGAATSAGADELPLELRMMLEASSAVDDELENPSGELSSKYAKLAQGSTVSTAKAAAPKASGRGRKAKQIESSSEVATISTDTTRVQGTDSTALWTFGWTQFSRYERNQVCIKVVSERMGKLAECIIRCMLERSIGVEMTPPQLTTHSIPSRVSDIVAAIDGRVSQKTTQTADQIRRILDLLRQEKMSAVSLSRIQDDGSPDAAYVVNIQSILEFLRRKTAHSITYEKFGDVSGRIFELLLDKKYLDQQRIGDLAIAPSRDVRTRMYEMYKAGFIDYIDISKRGDFNTLSTIFLWHVNPAKFKKAALDMVFKAIFNVRVRKQSECEQKKHVLELVDRSGGNNLDSSLAER